MNCCSVRVSTDTRLTVACSSEIRHIDLLLSKSTECVGSDRGCSVIAAETKDLRQRSFTHLSVQSAVSHCGLLVYQLLKMFN